jgi:hypothetical protein
MPKEYTQSGNGRFYSLLSIMMEKSALAGDGGGAPPFTLFTITYKVAVYTPAKRQIHSPYIYSVRMPSTLS